MSIHSKLLVSLLMLSIFGLAGIFVGSRSIETISDTLAELTQVASPTVEHSNDVVFYLTQAHLEALEALSQPDKSKLSTQRERFATHYLKFQKSLESLDQVIPNQELKELVSISTRQGEVFQNTVVQMLLAQEESMLSAEKLSLGLEKFEASQTQFTIDLNIMSHTHVARMKDVEEQADQMVSDPNAQLNELNELVNTLFQTDYVALETSKNLSVLVAQMSNIALKVLSLSKLDGLKELRDTFKQRADEAIFSFAVLSATSRTKSSQKDVSKLREAFESWVFKTQSPGQLFDAHISRIQANEKARQLSNAMNTQADALIQQIGRISDAAKQFSHSADQQATALVSSSNQKMLVILFATLGGSLVIGVLAFRKVTQPLRVIISSIRRLANNETELTIPYLQRKDEIGQMAQAIQVFKGNAENIKALDRERRQKAEEERKKEEKVKAHEQAQAEAHRQHLKALSHAFGAVVQSASNGDFTQRVDVRQFEDEALHQLAINVNELLTTVHDGIHLTTEILGKMAEGDLSRQMQGNFGGTFADLQNYINHTQERLSSLVKSIQTLTVTLHRQTHEITQDAQALSKRAESQAVALEETAVSIDEISTSVSCNAEGAQDVANLSRRATEKASAGRTVVADSVQAMRTIEACAKQIQEISESIQTIAFQTNVLALNAAVEASRAGEHGKGFAVVAVEVRGLALRSSDSAKQISELAETNATQIHTGASIVHKAGSTFEEITQGIEELNEKIMDISVASEQQASRIQAISTSIAEMDNNTQKNTHSAEQNAALARSLSESAQTLEQQVSIFKLVS